VVAGWQDVAFLQPSAKYSAIWMAPFSGDTAGTPQRLHDVNVGEDETSISPDGHWLAYASNGGMYLEPFPPHGGRQLVSTGSSNIPRWSRDEKQLYYWDFDSWMAVETALMVIAPCAAVPGISVTRPLWRMCPIQSARPTASAA
jgi:hypothetical protein